MSHPTAEDERRESVAQQATRLVRNQAAERARIDARQAAAREAWLTDPTRNRKPDVTIR